MRRRALATAATLPIVLFFQLVGLVIVETYNLVIAGTLLLFGYRELDFDPLRHPFQYSAKYIGRSKKPSVWWTKKSTDEFNYTTYPPRAAVFLVLNPPVIVGLLVLGAVMYVALGTLFYLVLGAATLAVLTALVFVGTLVTEPLRHRSKEAREQREKEEAERRARQREQLTRELALLACDGSGSRSASVSSLPKSRRTVHLRYYDLKAKVCKPFAR